MSIILRSRITGDLTDVGKVAALNKVLNNFHVEYMAQVSPGFFGVLCECGGESHYHIELVVSSPVREGAPPKAKRKNKVSSGR